MTSRKKEPKLDISLRKLKQRSTELLLNNSLKREIKSLKKKWQSQIDKESPLDFFLTKVFIFKESQEPSSLFKKKLKGFYSKPVFSKEIIAILDKFYLELNWYRFILVWVIFGKGKIESWLKKGCDIDDPLLSFSLDEHSGHPLPYHIGPLYSKKQVVGINIKIFGYMPKKDIVSNALLWDIYNYYLRPMAPDQTSKRWREKKNIERDHTITNEHSKKVSDEKEIEVPINEEWQDDEGHWHKKTITKNQSYKRKATYKDVVEKLTKKRAKKKVINRFKQAKHRLKKTK